jgi:hypothetical protein
MPNQCFRRKPRKIESREEKAASQLDLIIVVALIGACYFGYQYMVVHKQTDQLINKDFICQTVGGIPAFQNPHLLADYLRLNSVSARFASPDQAVRNEAERDRVTASGLVDLNAITPNTPLTERRNPLVVHVLDTYTAEKNVLLLRIRVVNKTHRGETWYIPADKINPLLNVTGFADKAVKMHKPGIDDVIESRQGREVLEKLNEGLKKHK